MHSVDSIDGKSGGTFWGQIAATFNSTTPPHHHRTGKQLKDQWCTYNTKVQVFNGLYLQEEISRQSRADNTMVIEVAKVRYEKKQKHAFKWEH